MFTGAVRDIYMENNFDLKKYDKKVALNYRWLGEQKPRGLGESSAALYGEACHYLYSGKLPQNSGELSAAIRAELSGDCSAYSIKLLSEAAIALTEYAVCLQQEGDCSASATALAATERALKQISVRAEICGAEDKLFALDAAACHYVCAKSDSSLKLYNALCELLKIKGDGSRLLVELCGGASGQKTLSVEALVRLCRAIFNIAIYENSAEEQTRAEDILRLCLDAGLTLNYSAKNDYFNPTYASATATAMIFSQCVRFYKLCGEQKYLSAARKIWYNGLQLCQRAEGFAGDDSVVINKSDRLCVTRYACPRASGYYAEALAVYAKNKELFAEAGGDVFRDKSGRIFMGDKIFAREESGFFGKDLIEIPTLTAFDKDVALQLRFNLFA